MKNFLRKKLDNCLMHMADKRFNDIVSDCTQSLMLLAVQSAVSNCLVDDGELTSLGNTLLDSYFKEYSSRIVAAPTSFPELEVWKIDTVAYLPDAVAEFFTGAEGAERLNCMLVFLLADIYAPNLSYLRLYNTVRSVIAAHIYEDTRDDILLHRVSYDGRKAYIEYANHLFPHLTLYGYSVFRASLPVEAQRTIPDIKTFIKLNGLKR